MFRKKSLQFPNDYYNYYDRPPKKKKLKSNVNGWVMFPRLVPVWLSLSPSRSIELVKYRYSETYLRTGER